MSTKKETGLKEKAAVKIGNRDPKNKITSIAKIAMGNVDSDEAEELKIQQAEAKPTENTSTYLPPAAVRKPTLPAAKKPAPAPSGKLDFSKIDLSSPSPNVPGFDVTRYITK